MYGERKIQHKCSFLTFVTIIIEQKTYNHEKLLFVLNVFLKLFSSFSSVYVHTKNELPFKYKRYYNSSATFYSLNCIPTINIYKRNILFK